MALSKEERAQLEALQAKEAEADDDDFDVEIWDETGAGAKVPYRKGRTWLQRFGIDLDPAPEGDDKGDGKPAPKSGATSDKGESRPGPAKKYFGSNKAS